MMNYSRKYVRVKKPASGPVTFLSAIPAHEEIIKVEPSSEEELATRESDSARTFLHVTSDDQQSNMNSDACVSPTYTSYADGLGKHFSSTTIVNGASISQLQFDDSCTDNTMVVLPLDSLEVPVEAMMTDDNDVQTIHVGSFSEVIHQQNLHENDTFITSTNSLGTCFLRIQREKPPMSVITHRPLLKKTIKPTSTEIIQSIMRPPPPTGTGGRKRGLIRYGRSRMIADTHTSIAVSEFKSQLNDTSDIIGKLDLAPSTKRMMHLLNTKGVNKLFANPGRLMGTRCSKYFIRHLTMRQMPVDVTFDDMPLQPVGYTPEVDPSTIKRITRKRKYPEAEEYQRKLFINQIQMTYFDNDVVGMETEVPNSVFVSEEVIIPDTEIVLQDPIGVAQELKEEVLGDNDVMYTDGIIEDAEYLEEHGEENDYKDNKSTIIMVHEGEETAEGSAYTQQNIEVLLAAAEKRGISRGNIQQVIICQGEVDGQTTFLPGNGQIVIMPNDSQFETITETVLTS